MWMNVPHHNVYRHLDELVSHADGLMMRIWKRLLVDLQGIFTLATLFDCLRNPSGAVLFPALSGGFGDGRTDFIRDLRDGEGLVTRARYLGLPVSYLSANGPAGNSAS